MTLRALRMKVENFIGTRVRCQRLSDMKLLSGWLVSMKDLHVRVQINHPNIASPGQELFLEAAGDGEKLCMRVRVCNVTGDFADLILLNEPQLLPHSDEVRILLERIPIQIRAGWYEVQGEILDVSLSGVAVQTSVELDVDVICQLTLTTRQGIIRIKGVVVYSRPQPGNAGFFRTGFQLMESDPVTDSQWSRLLSERGVLKETA